MSTELILASFQDKRFSILMAHPVRSLSLWNHRFTDLQQYIADVLGVPIEDPSVRSVIEDKWGRFLSGPPVWAKADKSKKEDLRDHEVKSIAKGFTK